MRLLFAMLIGSAFGLSRMSGGVPTGASRPDQPMNVRSLVPSYTMAGVSGSAGTRAGAVATSTWSFFAATERDCLIRKHPPVRPREAGTQFLQQSLGPRFRGGERRMIKSIRVKATPL